MKCLVYNWESMRNLQLEYISDVLPVTTRSITMIYSSSSPPYAIHGLMKSSHIWASARCAAASRAWFLASALAERVKALHSGKIRYDGKIDFIQLETIHSGKLA